MVPSCKHAPCFAELLFISFFQLVEMYDLTTFIILSPLAAKSGALDGVQLCRLNCWRPVPTAVVNDQTAEGKILTFCFCRRCGSLR